MNTSTLDCKFHPAKGLQQSDNFLKHIISYRVLKCRRYHILEGLNRWIFTLNVDDPNSQFHNTLAAGQCEVLKMK